MFFGHCAAHDQFDEVGDEPQGIECSEAIAARLTEWQRKKMIEMVDGRLGEVDWDVSESSSPIVISKNFPFFTGWCDRVETDDADRVFYAQVQRKGSPIWGRFVKKQIPRRTTAMTLVLRPVCDAGPIGWRVVAAYVGEVAPAFPGDPYASAMSIHYWGCHALLDGAIPYKKGTKTTTCPW